ncbi:MAG: FG-GAP repeat domain-containing protein, partial [Phycisphaerales bacterium]
RTIESGLAELEGWSTAAGFGDLDADGDLDLVVAHYVEWTPTIDEAVDYRLAEIGRAYGPPLGFAGETVRVFFNDGDGGFVDRTVESGFDVRNAATGEPMAKALGLLVQDLDGDRDLDVFVANDTVANLLFVNNGDGTFRETGAASGVAFDRSGAATGAMGVDLARVSDRSGDRRMIAVGNFANEPSSLYADAFDAPGRFADEAIPMGISAATRPALTFGVVWADLDGDGAEELVAANGHLEEAIGRLQASQSYRQPAQVFAFERGKSAGRMIELPREALGDLATPVVGRGLAWGDLDLDGDLDLVLTQIGGAPLVLFNETREASLGEARPVVEPAPPHWVRIVLEGPRGDASVVGATVRVTAGDRTIVRVVAPT